MLHPSSGGVYLSLYMVFDESNSPFSSFANVTNLKLQVEQIGFSPNNCKKTPDNNSEDLSSSITCISSSPILGIASPTIYQIII